jgi:TolB-like protein/tetratricopeptide (TPR) repeat protein
MSNNNSASASTSRVVRFGQFEADLDAGQLRKRGVKIALRDQSFQVLASLLERPGQLVAREDLCRRLWRDEVFVDFERGLNTAVARLREALGDSADHPRFIETLPKRGYRFIADVHAAALAAAIESPVRARLVVLPFLNLSGDPTQEYFSDAMTDEIITAVAGVAPEQLAVIARTTTMRYKGSNKDVARIGRELSVDYVVEGGVRRTEDQVAVTVQLIRTSDETHIFARKYETALAGVFGVHHDVAQAIARHIPAVAGGLGSGGGTMRRKPTADLAAYNEYLKGLAEMWKATPPSMARAKQHFEAALARDPEFALACDSLAQLYWYLGFMGFAPSREMDRIGRFYVLRAIEIDPTLAETHALLSFYPKQKQYDDHLSYYDWPASLRDVERARALNPNSPLVQLRYAIVLMILGRMEESAAQLKRALESDPLSLEVRAWTAEVLALGRHGEEALQHARRLVELEPEHFFSHAVLGQACLEMRNYDDSAAALREAVRFSGELPLMVGWLGLALGLGGHSADARAVLDRLHAVASERYVPPTSFAWTHLGLGDVDEAFVWMERALEAPDRMMAPIKSYSFLDPLRSDPRFAVLLRKMNLEP